MIVSWIGSLVACIGGTSTETDKTEIEKPTDAAVVLHPPVEPVPVVAPGDPAPPITANNCADEVAPPELQGPDCITSTIRCGETVIGTTAGGGSWFDTKFYEKKYCTPATVRHDVGHERVYALTLPPGDHRATVFLDTPCADLDLASMRVSDFDKCPTIDNNVSQCEMWPKGGNAREVVEMASQEETRWLIVVESKTEKDGHFALTVECKDGL